MQDLRTSLLGQDGSRGPESASSLPPLPGGPRTHNYDMRKCALSFLLAAGVVLGQTGQNVALPIFADTISNAGSTPYFVVWFASFSFVILFGVVVVLTQLSTGNLDSKEAALLTIKTQIGPMQIGLCDALNGMMVVFASKSSRTSPYLQAILASLVMPLTIIVRVALLNKIPTWKQLLASMLVLGGLFLSLTPTISQSEDPDVKGGEGIFWPLWFMAGFVPAALMNVIEEKVLNAEHRKANMVCFVFWLNFWQFVFVTSLFWLDVLPNYGMSADLSEWKQHMQNGFHCFFSTQTGFLWGLIFILCYMLTYIASGLLLRNSEGAVWQAVVQSLVAPLSTLWWALFQEKPYFHWEPKWDYEMTYAALGLAMMVPGIALYQILGGSPGRHSRSRLNLLSISSTVIDP